MCGTAWTKKYPELEYADYYRAGSLKKIAEADVFDADQAPWISVVPDLETCGWRGARMLDAKCWKNKCFLCKWAAMANVAIEDQFRIKVWEAFLTRDGLRIFVRKTGAMRNRRDLYPVYQQTNHSSYHPK